MVRIIKKDRVAYFCLAGVPLKWENKSIIKLEPTDPYYNILMSYESLKEAITEDEDNIKIGDVTFDKSSEKFLNENGEEADGIITETEEDAVTFMLESEEVEGDENKVIIAEDDEESIVSLQEVDGEDPAADDTEMNVQVDEKTASEEDTEEIELIISKLEDINSNITKLEDADLEQDVDLQKAYLEELGKKHLLEERLNELNYVSGDKKETVVSKILESYSYIDLRKKPEAFRLVESKKMGSNVNKHILAESRKRLIESIKKTGKLKESGVTIDYHAQDGNFVFSGDLSKYTDEQILLVPETDFFDVFDTIIKGFDMTPMNTRVLEEEEEDVNFNIKKVSVQKVAESLEALKEEEEEQTEMIDGQYYSTTCDLYEDQDGKISESVTVGCVLYCPANFISQYNKEHNCMVSEDGATFTISPEFLEPCGEIVRASDLVENETYTAVDDFGAKADVTFEGVDEASNLLEFKTKLKESFYMDKKMVHQYIRFKP